MMAASNTFSFKHFVFFDVFSNKNLTILTGRNYRNNAFQEFVKVQSSDYCLTTNQSLKNHVRKFLY